MSQTELAQLIAKYSGSDGIHTTAIPGLNCIRQGKTDIRLPDVYTPSVCIIVQGKKQVLLDKEIYEYRPSEYLAVSVDLPLIGIVTEASEQKPYLCLQVELDAEQLADLVVQMTIPTVSPAGSRAIFVGRLPDAVLDCAVRLARLLETPQDIPLLAPMLKREFYYRLLSTDHGGTIAQFARGGSHTQRIAAAIRQLKTFYTQPLRIEEMAEWAGMSISSFHAHFRNLTSMSPLQFQKQLRLVEARRMMVAEKKDAASTAYHVGYESPSQFSREYARMFGQPPRRDIEALTASQQA